MDAKEIAEQIQESAAVCSMKGFRHCTSNYIPHEELQAFATAYLRTQEPLGDEQVRLVELFDRYGVECGNCSARLIVRGGTRGEHHGLTHSDGEEEALCGFCAGEEIRRLQAEVKTVRDEAALANEGTQFYNRKAADAIVLRNAAEAEAADLRAQLAAAQQERDAALAKLQAAHNRIDDDTESMNKLCARNGKLEQAAEAREREMERLVGFIRQIFGSKYDAEIAAMLATPAATPSE